MGSAQQPGSSPGSNQQDTACPPRRSELYLPPLIGMKRTQIRRASWATHCSQSTALPLRGRDYGARARLGRTASQREAAARGQFIGKSSNAPWPKRKKLIVPASTAATTTIFLPALSIAKGFGRRAGGAGSLGGGGGGGYNQGNRRWKTFGGTGAGEDGSAVGFCGDSCVGSAGAAGDCSAPVGGA